MRICWLRYDNIKNRCRTSNFILHCWAGVVVEGSGEENRLNR